MKPIRATLNCCQCIFLRCIKRVKRFKKQNKPWKSFGHEFGDLRQHPTAATIDGQCPQSSLQAERTSWGRQIWLRDNSIPFCLLGRGIWEISSAEEVGGGGGEGGGEMEPPKLNNLRCSFMWCWPANLLDSLSLSFSLNKSFRGAIPLLRQRMLRQRRSSWSCPVNLFQSSSPPPPKQQEQNSWALSCRICQPLGTVF